MSEEDKNIKLYSVTDIQKYLDGKLSVTEMHDFEKAALEDPLLADAVEGVQNLVHPNEPFEIGMDDLTNRLQLRVAEEDKNELIPVPPNRLWWRAAAALIVLLAVSALTFTYLVNRKSPAENIATLKRPVSRDSAVSHIQPISDSSSAVVISPVDPGVSNPAPASHKEKQPKDLGQKNKDDEKVASTIPKSKREKKEITNSDIKSDTAKFMDASPAINVPIPVEDVLKRKVAGVQTLSRLSSAGFIRGRVIDANMQPVPGAVVSYKNLNKRVSTDKNGEFSLVTTKDSTASVRVNAVGFQPLSTTLKRLDDNVVQLQAQSTALSEVVVSGAGNRRKQEIEDEDSMEVQSGYTSPEKVTILKAMPATGWHDFNNYLARNRKIFTADSTIKGRETLSFTVDKYGRRSSFQIDNSLSPAHDAEAIRLIKEGPAWKLLKGKKARVTVNIEF